MHHAGDAGKDSRHLGLLLMSLKAEQKLTHLTTPQGNHTHMI